MLAPISRADGMDPTTFAIRCTAPPSSSVITMGLIPLGAAAFNDCSCAARSPGAAVPNRTTPPTPAETSARTAPTLRSSTGTTIVCAARRSSVHVAKRPPVVHAGVGDGVSGIDGGGLDATGVASAGGAMAPGGWATPVDPQAAAVTTKKHETTHPRVRVRDGSTTRLTRLVDFRYPGQTP